MMDTLLRVYELALDISLAKCTDRGFHPVSIDEKNLTLAVIVYHGMSLSFSVWQMQICFQNKTDTTETSM